LTEKNRSDRHARLGARVLVVAGALAGAAVVALRRVNDADLPWHLAFGKLVAALGRIPRVDDFAQDHRPIRYAEVLSDLAMYGAYRMLGPFGLSLLAALSTLALAGLLWAGARRAGPVAVPVVALALAATGPWLAPRAATFSFVLIALYAFLIDQRRRHGASRRGRAAILACVPLTAVWANLHGFVLLGIALVALYAGYSVLCRALASRAGALLRAADGEDLAVTLVAAALTVPAACASIAGPHLLLAPFEAARDFGRIAEWERPSFGLLFDYDAAALLLAVVTLAALALGKEPESKARVPNLFEAGSVIFGLALGASTVRMIPAGAVLVAPFVARRLSAFVRELPTVRLVSASTALLLAPVLAIDPGFRLGRGFDLQRYPEGAVGYIERAAPRGPMWNHLPYGGWLVFRLYPRYHVLIDGRTGWVHDPRLVKAAIESETDPNAFERLVSERHIEWAVTRATEGLPFGLGLAQSPEFSMVYLDENSAVYVRRDGENRALATEGYRVLRHDVPPRSILKLALSGARTRDLAHDADLLDAQAPGTARAALISACAGIATGDRARLAAAERKLTPPEVSELEMAWHMRRP
jgi:hypothetical protein